MVASLVLAAAAQAPAPGIAVDDRGVRASSGWLGRNEPPKRAPVHDRMPAILPPSDWADWLNGPPDAAGLLCRPYELPMSVLKTGEPWAGARRMSP